MNFTKQAVIATIALAGSEALYIGVLKKVFKKVFSIEKPEGVFDDANISILRRMVYIAVMLFAILYFLIYMGHSVIDSFIFGAVLQGFFCAKNWAMVKGWNCPSCLIYVLWRAIEFAFVVWVARAL